MKKFIIAIIAVFITTSAFSQNYFSEIATINEYGSVKVEKVNGRIYIKDSTIVIKTENGKIEKLKIRLSYIDGSKDEPLETDDGLHYYESVYICDNKISFSKITVVTEYTHSYVTQYWELRYRDDNYETIKTKLFAYPSLDK